MIVIVLIGIIGSVIGYNMKGSLDKGRAFKSQYAIEQIKDILMLAVAKGADIKEVVNRPEVHLTESGLVKNASSLLKDGWGTAFIIGYENDAISVSSPTYDAYLIKHPNG
jgi:type II secretory pathway pseudopilin PulG